MQVFGQALPNKQHFDIEERAQEIAKQKESEKAKSKAAARHVLNYKKQEKIIEVYESGDYKKQFHTKNKKMETARRILKHVNGWCNAEGIPLLTTTDTGGVKTVRLCIENYEKEKLAFSV